MDRGGSNQKYNLNFLKPWRKAVHVTMVMVVPEREELGPEASPKSAVQLTLVPCEDHQPKLPVCNDN